MHIALGLAHASDILLDGNGEATRDAIARAIADKPGATLTGTLRPLAAALFARFSTGDPNATAGLVAGELSDLVVGVFGCQGKHGSVEAVRVAGQLVASDFHPVDELLVQEAMAVPPVLVIVGVTQCVMTMSVVLAHLADTAGGDAIRWVIGTARDPDPQARVILQPGV